MYTITTFHLLIKIKIEFQKWKKITSKAFIQWIIRNLSKEFMKIIYKKQMNFKA